MLVRIDVIDIQNEVQNCWTSEMKTKLQKNIKHKFKIAGLLKWKHNNKKWNKIISKHKEYNIKIKSEDNEITFIVRVTNPFSKDGPNC